MEQIWSVFSSPLAITCALIGLALFFILFFSLGKKQQKRGKILEKQVRGKGKWVQVVFLANDGKRYSFLVDRQTSQYLFPGDVGVLQQKRFGKATYVSTYTGLASPVVGKGRTTLVPLLFTGLFLGGGIAYYMAYPYLVKELKRKHLLPSPEASISSENAFRVREPKTLPFVSGPSLYHIWNQASRSREKRDLWSQLASPLYAEQAFSQMAQAPKVWRSRVLTYLQGVSPKSPQKLLLTVQCIRLLGTWRDSSPESQQVLRKLLSTSEPLIVFWTHWALCQIHNKPFELSWPLSPKELPKIRKIWNKGDTK